MLDQRYVGCTLCLEQCEFNSLHSSTDKQLGRLSNASSDSIVI